MSFDKIVRGGTVVTPSGPVKADVGIRDEKIAAIGKGLSSLSRSGAEIVDAKGHLVLPGVIDVHVHLDLPFCGTVSSDDYRTGTRAGARGGVTTLIDFAIPYAKRGGKCESLREAADNWHRRAEGKTLIDYSLHVCITQWEQHRRQIKAMIDAGYTTFKEFMIYESEGWQSDDRAMFNTLEAMRDLGGMLMVHAESSRVLDEMIARHHTPALMKKLGARLHGISRPNFTEYEAIQRAVTWASVTGGPLCIVHMSTGEGCDILREAQEAGVPVVAETCPQYLVFDDSVFAKKDGHLYASCPQVKKPEDSERLWAGLRGGEVSWISTDTCTFTRRQKSMWKGDWTKIPMGLPGLETLLPVVYTRGVLDKRLTLTEMCRLLSTNPAKATGLYPRKGAIEIGADADLAIIHPKKAMRVDHKKMETNADWSPYQGWNLAGFARTTLSRGDVIVDGYKVVGKRGRGQFVPRRTPSLTH